MSKSLAMAYSIQRQSKKKFKSDVKPKMEESKGYDDDIVSEIRAKAKNFAEGGEVEADEPADAPIEAIGKENYDEDLEDILNAPDEDDDVGQMRHKMRMKSRLG